jgi:hypothetical protein
MGALSWIKVLLPILLEYGKEILNPQAENKRSTVLERVSVLVIVSLFCMLVYVGEQFFVLHGENVRLNTTIAHLNDTVEAQQLRIGELVHAHSRSAVEEPPKTPEPYDKRGDRNRLVVREEDTRTVNQDRMIDWINGTN